MNAAELPISRALWTTAIHLAGRASGRVFKRDLQRAIGIWHQMERVAGIESDNVVFSTLFDISIKAGQYTVADRLMAEMKKRNIEFTRTMKVSKIYYHGFLGDVEGIRQTFDKFVKSGEIVDTVVLNCLIVSFLKAGELSTAEQLYERMMEAQKKFEKELHAAGNQRLLHHPSLTSDMPTYRKRMRELRRTLQLSTSLKDKLPEEHRLLQASLPMTPDTRTFHIFLSHHASQTGNLYKFMSVLRDMERTFEVPPRAMVYLFLFEGFARFGRKRRHWSAERLRDVWRAYLRLLYETRMSVIDRSVLRRDKLLWENPLTQSIEEEMRDKLLKDVPNELYTPLPFQETNPKEQNNKDVLDEEEQEENEADADEDEADEMLKNPRRNVGMEKELGELERRIENGVFLGRRVILAILRAFGACSGPDAVMDAWIKLERIWQPKKRKTMDVMAIKEELEKQLGRKGVRR
jgi:pentatricopeptide repeat protein